MNQENATPIQPQKTKSNIGLIVSLVISICLLIGVSVVLLVVLLQKNDKNDDETNCKVESSSSKSDQTDIDLAQDTAREDDLARFLTAANDYQANNSGRTPWSSGYTNTYFVRRYIDADCIKLTPDTADSTCGEMFRDPDGSPYFFVYGGELTSDKKVTPTRKHGIYVYTKAKCGSEDGEVELGVGNRQYAMLYKLSDGSVTCNDNH